MSHIQMDSFRSIFKSKAGDYHGGLLFHEGRDAEVLLGLANVFRPRNFLEIGVFSGATAKMILDTCPFIEKYVGVDFRRLLCDEKYLKTIRLQEGQLIGHLAFSDPRFSMHYLEDESGDNWTAQDIEPVDMVFIDGDHQFKSVERDTQRARQALRDGVGVIVWHDYNNAGEPGVGEYIRASNKDNMICYVEGSDMCVEFVGDLSCRLGGYPHF
jgi:predicted O-methyltransferase YrrM